MWVLAIPWKLIGALCRRPPTGRAGCFMAALVYIGVLTALIGDLASKKGCRMGLKVRNCHHSWHWHLAPRHVWLHVGRRVRASRRRLHCQHHRLQLRQRLPRPRAAGQRRPSTGPCTATSKRARGANVTRGAVVSTRCALPSRRATSASPSPSSAAALSSASPRVAPCSAVSRRPADQVVTFFVGLWFAYIGLSVRHSNAQKH